MAASGPACLHSQAAPEPSPSLRAVLSRSRRTQAQVPAGEAGGRVARVSPPPAPRSGTTLTVAVGAQGLERRRAESTKAPTLSPSSSLSPAPSVLPSHRSARGRWAAPGPCCCFPCGDTASATTPTPQVLPRAHAPDAKAAPGAAASPRLSPGRGSAGAPLPLVAQKGCDVGPPGSVSHHSAAPRGGAPGPGDAACRGTTGVTQHVSPGSPQRGLSPEPASWAPPWGPGPSLGPG